MKVKVIKNVLNIGILLLIILPSFLSVSAATTNNSNTIEPTRIVNLESFTGTGYCEDKGMYSVFTGSSGFEGTGSLQAMMYTVSNFINGCAQIKKDAKTGAVLDYYMVGGGLGSLSNTAGILYDSKPASLAWDIKDTIAKINPVKDTQAASTDRFLPQVTLSGTGLLSSIKDFHKSVQDLVLSLYVIVFAVIAFGILFRNKLGGQEYITLVNSIPRIVISLILVAFSLPISGLIIDVGNIGYSFIYNIYANRVYVNIKADPSVNFPGFKGYLSQNPGINDPILNTFQPDNPDLSVWRVFGQSGAASIIDPTQPAANLQIIGPDTGAPLTNLLTSSLTAIVGTLSGFLKDANGNSVLGQNAGTLNGIIALILSIGVFFSMFKVFFALLKEFIIMLFYPIFSPFFFGISALPGQSKSITNYIRTLLSSVLSFVAVYAVFVMIIFLGKNYIISDSTLNIAPPLLGFAANGANLGIVSSLAAYGLFVLSPNIPSMVKSALAVSEGGAGKLISQVGDVTKGSLKKIPIVGGLIS